MAGTLTTFLSKLDVLGRVGFWKALVIAVALLNIKSLPLAWHFRLLNGLFTHLRSSRVRLASKSGPAALFQPMIISSRSGFLECDYNFHKSNSTYFSDFDVARLQLLVNLCTHGMEKTRKELAKEKGSFDIMLAGVSCNFKREIKPYEGFEIWTRILTWDKKWLYVIGHFVKKGAVKPEEYTLQPWRKTKKGAVKETFASTGDAHEGKVSPSTPHPAIFASAIAKYVFKKGRLTIPPERVLQSSELLPPRPAAHETPSISESPAIDGTAIDAAAVSAAKSLSADNSGEILAASLTAASETDIWDWERVEKERERGMRIADFYSKLDALNDEFTGEESPALGHY